MNANANPETGPKDPWTVWRESPAAPDDVCRALANGSTLKQWTQSYNFDYFEVAHWLLSNPTRAYNYERSLQICAHYLRDEILEIADDSSQDLITDAKGKTTINHAHFRRQGRQIEARKAIIRQITTGKRPAKDQKPYADVEAEINKILTQPGPYDPKGTLKGYKPSQPAYDPGPPPISSATRQLGAATIAPLHPNPNFNPAPDLPPLSGPATRVNPCNPWLSSQRTFPSYKAYLRAIRESDWIEGQPLPFPYLPAPDAARQEAVPPSIASSAKPADAKSSDETASSQATVHTSLSAMDGAHTSVPAQSNEMAKTEVALRTTDHASLPQEASSPQPSTKAQIGGILPKVDWYKLLGMRTLSAFLALFLLFLATATANLHASIRSLSVLTGNHRNRPRFDPPFTLSGPCSQTWSAPRPEIDPPRTTNHEQQTNPSAHSRRSRDAPCYYPHDT